MQQILKPDCLMLCFAIAALVSILMSPFSFIVEFPSSISGVKLILVKLKSIQKCSNGMSATAFLYLVTT